MKYNRFETAFDSIFPLPLKAIGWLLLLFIVSVFRRGWDASLENLLYISVLLFDIMFVVNVRKYILYRNQLHKKELTKILLSILFFVAFNVVLLLTTTWIYSIALFLIPIPALILFYFFFKRLRGGNVSD